MVSPVCRKSGEQVAEPCEGCICMFGNPPPTPPPSPARLQPEPARLDPGPESEETRLRCLELAAQAGGTETAIMERAEVYLGWVRGPLEITSFDGLDG